MTDQMEDQEEVYVIEKIVDKKTMKDGRVKYFLKWKDYPESDNTWEFAEDLECDDLIKIFEDELKSKLAAAAATTNSNGIEEITQGQPSGSSNQINDSNNHDDPFSPRSSPPIFMECVNSPETILPSTPPKSPETILPDNFVPKPVGKIEPKKRMTGFDKGYTVETILGITLRKNNRFGVLIKWKEVETPTLEDREIVNIRCPQKIIAFYQKRLVWTQ